MNELLYQDEYSNAFDVATVVGEVPEGRAYAAMASLDGGLWVYGGYRRPGSPERLASLWKATLA